VIIKRVERSLSAGRKGRQYSRAKGERENRLDGRPRRGEGKKKLRRTSRRGVNNRKGGERMSEIFAGGGKGEGLAGHLRKKGGW